MIKTYFNKIQEKKQKELIEKIHNEFDQEQDRLLNDAISIINEPENKELLPLSQRLSQIGFVNTPIVKKAKETVIISKENSEIIKYYKDTYPFIKFITEDSLDRICNKYNLIYAPVTNYIKDVPVKNLKEIENAQSLKIEDSIKKTRILTLLESNITDNCPQEIKKELMEGKILNEFCPMFESLGSIMRFEYPNSTGANKYNNFDYTGYSIETIDKEGLFIAAPKTHFNLEGLNKKSKYGFFNSFKKEIKDPIVFRYVRGGVQILSKWGLEANDPELIVDRLN